MRKLPPAGLLLFVLIGSLACERSTETAKEPTPAAPIDEAKKNEIADLLVADRSRERYPDTNLVRGYLRRVR